MLAHQRGDVAGCRRRRQMRDEHHLGVVQGVVDLRQRPDDAERRIEVQDALVLAQQRGHGGAAKRGAKRLGVEQRRQHGVGDPQIALQ